MGFADASLEGSGGPRVPSAGEGRSGGGGKGRGGGGEQDGEEHRQQQRCRELCRCCSGGGRGGLCSVYSGGGRSGEGEGAARGVVVNGRKGKGKRNGKEEEGALSFSLSLSLEKKKEKKTKGASLALLSFAKELLFVLFCIQSRRDSMDPETSDEFPEKVSRMRSKSERAKSKESKRFFLSFHASIARSFDLVDLSRDLSLDLEL